MAVYRESKPAQNTIASAAERVPQLASPFMGFRPRNAGLHTESRNSPSMMESREEALMGREKKIAKREGALAKREEGQAKREEAVAKREEGVAKREEAVSKRKGVDSAMPPNTTSTYSNFGQTYEDFFKGLYGKPDEASDTTHRQQPGYGFPFYNISSAACSQQTHRR